MVRVLGSMTGRAEDADGVDAAAAGPRIRRRGADVVLPHGGAAGLVDGDDVVAGGDGKEDALSAGAVLEIQRRRPHVARKGGAGGEGSIALHGGGGRPGQRGLHEVSIA